MEEPSDLREVKSTCLVSSRARLLSLKGRVRCQGALIPNCVAGERVLAYKHPLLAPQSLRPSHLTRCR